MRKLQAEFGTWTADKVTARFKVLASMSDCESVVEEICIDGSHRTPHVFPTARRNFRQQYELSRADGRFLNLVDISTPHEPQRLSPQ